MVLPCVQVLMDNGIIPRELFQALKLGVLAMQVRLQPIESGVLYVWIDHFFLPLYCS